MSDKDISDDENLSDGEECGAYEPEEVEQKVTPKPPPPKGPKGPKTPEEELGARMKIAIHKIGGAVMEKKEMDALWAPCDVDEKYMEVLETDEIQNLLSDKLRHCAALGNISSMEFLHSKGGDVNAVEKFTGNTPLMIAVGVTHDFDRQKKVITFLMEHDADCNIKNKYGLSPKSAIPGFADSPSVIHVREMDLKMKDVVKERLSQQRLSQQTQS